MAETGLRLIISPEMDPVLNLAIEEALHLSSQKTGETIARFWRCDKAVILGNARKINDDVFAENCRDDGIPLVRRHSGGGTVYVHPDVLNFSIITPYKNENLRPRSRIAESVDFLLKPVVNALKVTGKNVEIINRGDICLDGLKIGGSAQARKAKALLHHSTLMQDDRLEQMVRYLPVPPERKGVPHADFVTSFLREDIRFDQDDFIEQVSQGWASELGLKSVKVDRLTNDESVDALRLVDVKYSRERHNLKR